MSRVPPEERGPITTIDALDCRYLVPREHPDPPAVASRLDAVARGPLAERCARALTAALDPGDPAVWVIRRLDVGLTLPVGLHDPEALARLWAGGIATRIARVVRGDAAVPDAIRYPDRTAYLAAFAVDTMDGQAAGRWEYATFAGLRPVPAGQAVVGAAAQVGVSIVDVVVRLARTGRLSALLDRLAPADARAIWHACLARAGPAPADRAVPAVWAHRAAARAGEPVPLAALRLLGAALADAAATVPVEAIVAAAARVAERLAGRAPGGGAGPPVAEERGPARRDGGAGAGTEARPRGDAGTDPPASGVHGAGHPDPWPATDPTRAAEYPTPFAGVLLLIPSLLDAGLHEAAIDASGGDPALAAVLRHRVLARCLGARRAGPATADPALRAVAGVVGGACGPDEPLGPAVRPEPVLAALTALLAAQGRAELADAPDLEFFGVGSGDPVDGALTAVAHAGVRLFALRLIGFGQASAGHLAANVYCGAGVVRVWPAGDVDVDLEPCPLQVLLNLAGLDALACRLPWRGGELSVHTLGGSWR